MYASGSGHYCKTDLEGCAVGGADEESMVMPWIGEREWSAFLFLFNDSAL